MTLYETLDALDDRTRSEVEAELGNGEKFVIGVRTAGHFLKRFRHRMVVTTDQFIDFPAGVQTVVNSIPLSGVTSVETGRVGRVGAITLRGPGDLEESFRMRSEEATRLANAIRDQLAERKERA